MKDRLDRHAERLSPDERMRLWERLSPAARAQRETSVRRWTVSFGLAVVVVAIAAAMITEHKEERARQDRKKPVEIVPYRSTAIPSGPASAGQIGVSPRPTNGRDIYRVPETAPPFTDTKRDSLSSFALILGGTGLTASRRFLDQGVWPPRDVVWVEDFVNAFEQGYPEVAAADFGIFLDGAPSPFGDDCQLVRVGVKARGGAADSGKVVARDARVLVRFDARSVVSHRLIGFDARETASGTAHDGGTITSGHEVTALYEVHLAKRRAPGRILSVRIDYGPPGGSVPRSVDAQLVSTDLHPLFATAPARLRLDAAVAEFAEILRRYPWTANHRIAEVLPMVRQLAQELHGDPEVVELADLVERTASLEAADVGLPSR